MKCFVCDDRYAVPAVTVLTLAIVAATGTGAGGAYVFTFVFLAVLIGWRRLQESPDGDGR